MKTLIIGASGKIGRYFPKTKQYLHTYNKNKIKNGIKFNIFKNKISKILDNNVSSVIILSAYSDPEFCFKNKSLSKKLNVNLTKKIIDTLVKENIYFIFLSSEYVFKGDKGNYNENSIAQPKTIYGKQKFEIEKYIIKKTKNFCILRISKTYGDFRDNESIINSMMYQIINGETVFKAATDQRFNPLYVKDLIKIISLFIKRKIKGIFNVGGPEKLSRYMVYLKIREKIKKKKKINIRKILLNKIKFSEPRPLNLTFNIKKLKKVINFKLTKIDTIINKIVKKNEKLIRR